MKYYTVETRSLNGKSVKFYRGIKARSGREAMEHVKRLVTHPDDRWEMRVSLSKWRDRKRTPGLDRHEARAQNRSPYATAAKLHSRRGLKVVKDSWPLQYHLLTFKAWQPDAYDASKMLKQFDIMPALVQDVQDMLQFMGEYEQETSADEAT